MTEEENQTVLKWAGMLGDWLVEASGNGDERDSLKDLIAGKTTITVETIITIGLTSGKEIVLHNRCFESYMRNSYLGDTLFCEDGFICAEYMDYEAGDLWHRARMVPTSVCYFDVKDIELNWPALYKQYMSTHNIRKEGAKDKLPDNQPETMTAKYWEVFGND